MRGVMPRWTFCTSPMKREPGGRGQRRQDPVHDRQAGHQRQHTVALGLAPPQLLQLLDLLRVHGRQVVRL